MKRTYTSKSEEVYIDFYLEDVIEFIDQCSEYEFRKIRERVDNSLNVESETLYDREVQLLLEEASKKYTLQQLQEKLK